MNIFKKHSGLSWDNITWKQYKLISEIDKDLSDEDRLIEIMKIVYGEKSLDWSIQLFKEKAKELAFMSKPAPVNNVKLFYKVNGHKYKFQKDPQAMTTVLYIDYTNFIKALNIEGAVAVFLIPKGHKYNEGYDLLDVINDIMDMPVVEVTGISFFYKRYLSAYTKIFQYYMTKKIKKDKTMSPEMKDEMILRLKMSSNMTLELFLMS